MLDNTIYIKGDDGKEVKMNILFTFELEEKKYVIVYEDGYEDELYPFVYDEEGNLYPVEDEKVLDTINEVVEAFDEGDDEE